MWGIYLIICIGLGFLCEHLGQTKGQKGCFMYGFLLGFIGLIIVLCLKDKSSEIKNVSNNKYENLEKIQKLKEAGAITEEEFNIEKNKLLN